mgnify:FL=1
MNLNYQDLKNRFGESIHKDEKLSKYNWFNLGGNAELFFKAKSLEELKSFIKYLKKFNIKINIIGAGSNLLIRDGGIKEVTIKLGSKFSYLNLIDENTIEVGAATLDRKIADFALQNSLSGLEFLSCIPGTIGGGVIMNSGCYGYDISKIVKSVKFIDKDGEIKEMPSSEIKFFYRGSSFNPELIIVSVQLIGKKNKQTDIEKKQLEFIERKKISQPSQIKTCGSTFKNPTEKKAWKLIKDTGCHIMTVGKAKISEKHCNFFINEGGAKSSEIEELINKVKKKVFEKTGIDLELEIKIIGQK